MKIYKLAKYITTNYSKYLYRVEPKGNIWNVIRSGLYTYHPSQMPGSFIDDPDVNTWPDQEHGEGSYRLYFAHDMWDLDPNRFRIRVPYDLVANRLESDAPDFYIDTGNSSEQIVTPSQLDIDMGQDQWIRGDYAQDILGKKQLNLWENMYKQDAGHYKNRFQEPIEDEEYENL